MKQNYLYILATCLLIWVSACNSPLHSQRYFSDAVEDNAVLEPIHQTALYTVYFDHALRRCVLHSSYTWGESGGGTGGTGIGVTVFNCNPEALKQHAKNLERQVANGIQSFEFPSPQVPAKKTTPPSAIAVTPTPEAPSITSPKIVPQTPSISPATPQSSTASSPPTTSTPPESTSPSSLNTPSLGSPTRSAGAASPSKKPAKRMQPIYQPQ